MGLSMQKKGPVFVLTHKKSKGGGTLRVIMKVHMWWYFESNYESAYVVILINS